MSKICYNLLYELPSGPQKYYFTFMNTIEVYPGAERTLVQAGDTYSIFDEASLDYLTDLGLDRLMTNPDSVHAFLTELKPREKFPGVRHFDTPRVYLREGQNGDRYVLKSFPARYDTDWGLKHLGTQEALHDALQDIEGYRAARVLGHVGLSAEGGRGYAVIEFVDAFTYGQIDTEMNHTSPLTRAVARATDYLTRAKRGRPSTPPNTQLGAYLDLCLGAQRVCNDALSNLGIASRGNWDLSNYDNFLCTADESGNPEVAIIDQCLQLFSPKLSSGQSKIAS